jgi:transcription elongation GreA/GreB family factor
MSTPTGDESAFLHELEVEVREELARAETIEAATEAAEVSMEAWLSDPADDQRYEVSLHVVLGAVEAMENGSGPGGPP